MEFLSRYGYWIALGILAVLGLHLVRGAEMGAGQGFWRPAFLRGTPEITYAGGGATLGEDEALVSAARASGALRLNTPTVTTTHDKLEHLRAGQADAAIVLTGLGVDYAGVGSLASLGRAYLHIIVPADSEVQRFRDLGGLRIGAGTEGGDTHLLARRLVGYLSFVAPPQVLEAPQRELGRAFAAGEIDAAFVLERLWAPALDELLATGQYRLAPVQEAETLARMLTGVEPDTLPSGVYGPARNIPPLDAPDFGTLSVGVVLAGAASLSAHDGHALLSALEAAGMAPGLPVLEPPPAQAAAGLAVHPGAQRFHGQLAPVSRQDLSAFARLLVGLALLVLAAVHLLYLLRAEVDRRKRRELRHWLEDVQDIGGRMEVAESQQELARLVDELASKQRLAERAWMQGKLGDTHAALLFQTHLVRVLSAFSRGGGGALPLPVPYDSEEAEEDLPYRIVRPDYGEALVSSVRARPQEERAPEPEMPQHAEANEEFLPPWRRKHEEPRHWLEEEPPTSWPTPSSSEISGGLSPDELPGDEALGPVRVRKRTPEPDRENSQEDAESSEPEAEPDREADEVPDVVIVERAEAAAERPQEKRKVRRKRRRGRRARDEEGDGSDADSANEQRPRRSGKGGENQMPLL